MTREADLYDKLDSYKGSAELHKIETIKSLIDSFKNWARSDVTDIIHDFTMEALNIKEPDSTHNNNSNEEQFRVLVDRMEALEVSAIEAFNDIVHKMQGLHEQAIRKENSDLEAMEKELEERFKKKENLLQFRKHRFRSMAEAGYKAGYAQAISDVNDDIEVDPEEAAEEWADETFGTFFEQKNFVEVANDIFARELETNEETQMDYNDEIAKEEWS